MSIKTVSTIKLSIDIINQIMIMAESNLIDNNIWNKTLSELMTPKEIIKTKLVFSILGSDVTPNVETFTHSCGPTITSIVGAIQVLFSRIDIEETRQRMLEWMESRNKNEGEYLSAASIVKNINTAIEAFNYCSRNIKVLNKCRFYLDLEDEVLMVACEF
jgi:hypothetical protein